MENKKSISKKVLFGIIGVSLLIILVLILAFVIFYSRPKEVEKEVIDAGDISMTYTDNFNGLTITNAIPTTDEVGMSLSGADQYFDFTVTTDVIDNATVNYEISLLKNKVLSNISDSDIRIYLEKQNSGSYVGIYGPENYTALTKKTKIGSPKGSIVVAKESNKNSTVSNYRLRMWLSDKAVVSDEALQNYTVEVLVNGKAE